MTVSEGLKWCCAKYLAAYIDWYLGVYEGIYVVDFRGRRFTRSNDVNLIRVLGNIELLSYFIYSEVLLNFGMVRFLYFYMFSSNNIKTRE